MMTTFKRVLKSGWHNFSRDWGISAATVFILFTAVFLVSSLFLSREAGKFLISSLEEKVDISVYFKEDAPEGDILKARDELLKTSEVKDVVYVSKERALEDFVEIHKNNPVLMESLEEVGGNPFLASLNIKAWQAGFYDSISNFLDNASFKNIIESVDYYQRKPIIDRIFSLTSFAERAGIIVSILSIIVAVLVTFNTVRLAIVNSSEEIKIQRLVGASNWFIRGPFLIQAAISGILGALISLSILSLVCWFLGPRIEGFFSGLNIFNLFMNNFWLIFFLQFLTGIFLAVISSATAIRKFLKA